MATNDNEEQDVLTNEEMLQLLDADPEVAIRIAVDAALDMRDQILDSVDGEENKMTVEEKNMYVMCRVVEVMYYSYTNVDGDEVEKGVLH